MEWMPIELEFPQETINELLNSHKLLVEKIESVGRLKATDLDELTQQLSKTILKQQPLLDLVNKVEKDGEFYHVNLQHQNTQILNLPWGLAKLPGDTKILNNVERLLISKNPLKPPPKNFQIKGGPLKILMMISSPKDIDLLGRLRYEEEELLLIKAFGPLLKAGEIQIDFTDNGSLDSLKQKIDKNDYHILHFSGHGVFDQRKKKGFLLLENHLSLNSEHVEAEQFAEALLKESFKIPLVLLSACQTAQTSSETALAGMTDALLQKGIPTVISMGMSIRDDYAALFAAEFYKQLALKKSVPQSFKLARDEMRLKEQEEIRRHNDRRLPGQWIIPNLFMTDNISPVDWKLPFKVLTVEQTNVSFVNSTLAKPEDKTDVFIGRREDFAAIMPLLADKKPIMLKGQGGIGKTTMAKKLIRRLQLIHSDLVPFIFNEDGKEFSLAMMLNQLQNYAFLMLVKEMPMDYYNSLNDSQRLLFLLQFIAQERHVVYLFDNLETFQNNKPGEFTTEHQGVLTIISFLKKQTKTFVIFTGRFPIKDLEQDIKAFDLGDVLLNDFILKCFYLGLKLDVTQIEFLYKTLGGNFRSLEFFNRAMLERPENKTKVFADIETFKKQTKQYSDLALAEMAENLFFSHLWDGLQEKEKQVANALYHYNLPVLDMALKVQDLNSDLDNHLVRLKQVTLLQAHLDQETKLVYYYMPPLVKNLMLRNKLIGPLPEFFFQKAGDYHLYIFNSVQKNNINEHEAAFYQFLHAGNKVRVNEIGKSVAIYYYGRSFYFNSLEIAKNVYELIGKETPFWCLNRLGMIGLSLGDYEFALPFFQQLLQSAKGRIMNEEEKENFGTTLNNISQIYDARGDYDTALDYLKKSLKIREEIGDIVGEAVTCFNMASIFENAGDLGTAIKLVSRTVTIDKQVGHPDLESDSAYLSLLIEKMKLQ